VIEGFRAHDGRKHRGRWPRTATRSWFSQTPRTTRSSMLAGRPRASRRANSPRILLIGHAEPIPGQISYR
jgi:hypothetical protein